MENPSFPSIKGIKYKRMGDSRIGIRLGRVLRFISIFFGFVLVVFLILFSSVLGVELSRPWTSSSMDWIIGLSIGCVALSFLTFCLNYTQWIILDVGNRIFAFQERTLWGLLRRGKTLRFQDILGVRIIYEGSQSKVEASLVLDTNSGPFKLERLLEIKWPNITVEAREAIVDYLQKLIDVPKDAGTPPQYMEYAQNTFIKHIFAKEKDERPYPDTRDPDNSKRADNFEGVAFLLLIGILFSSMAFGFAAVKVFVVFPGFEWVLLGAIITCTVLHFMAVSRTAKPKLFWIILDVTIFGIAVMSILMITLVLWGGS